MVPVFDAFKPDRVRDIVRDVMEWDGMEWDVMEWYDGVREYREGEGNGMG